MSKELKVNLAETFTSIQGEGHLVGNRTFFIRFSGCSVFTCPLHPSNSNLCDTDWSNRDSAVGVEGIEALAQESFNAVGKGGWVSITGGEPTDQPLALDTLSAEIRRLGMQLQIQSAGTKKVVCPWDWLTISPKGPRSKIAQSYGQELKVIYDGQSLDELREWYETTKFWFYYLQPTWRDGTCNMRETINMVHRAYEAGIPFLLSTQMHKWAEIR